MNKNLKILFLKTDKVTDGLVVKAGVSVTWTVLSWSGGHEFAQSGRTGGAWYFCPKSYLNQKVKCQSYVSELFNAPFNEDWSRKKKFAVTNLRTLGGIKAGTDGNMLEALSDLMTKLHKLDKQPTDISEVCLLTATNIMSGILFNKRFDIDDPELKHLYSLVKTWYETLNQFSWIMSLLPSWLAKIHQRKQFRDFRKASDDLRRYIADEVEEHQKTFDPNHMRDFVDMYLNRADIEIGKAFYDTVMVFMPDSTDTIAVFMRWIVLYVTLHPEVQMKICKEIDDVVGRDQMVSNFFMSTVPVLTLTKITEISLFF